MPSSELLPADAQTTAGELFKAGRLGEAIAAQGREVKQQPTDPDRRLFLFELLAFEGNLDRAAKQLEAVDYHDMPRDAAVAIYRRLIDAERLRRSLYQEGVAPRYLIDPPPHVELRLDALNQLRGSEPEVARRLLAEAAEQMPTLAGTLNGRPFELLVDCDDRFGTVLEVMSVTGAYFWVPLECVASLTVSEPQVPRDLVWLPADLELTDGQTGHVYLPTLYPGSCRQSDDLLKLGRQTDWALSDTGPVCGFGQRMFLCDDDVVGLLEWRSLELA